MVWDFLATVLILFFLLVWANKVRDLRPVITQPLSYLLILAVGVIFWFAIWH